MLPSEKPEFPPLLPVGLHPISLEELRKLCVDDFPLSATRPEIMKGLEEAIADLERHGIVGDLWIDGSFLTRSTNPKDVDIVLKVQWDFYQSASPEQKEKLRWFESTQPKHSYRCDSFKWIEFPPGHEYFWESEWERSYWIRQYGYSRELEFKGISVIHVGGVK